MDRECPPGRQTVMIIEPDTPSWDELAAVVHPVACVTGGGLAELRARCSSGEGGLVVLGPGLADDRHLDELDALDLAAHGILAVLVARAVTPELLHRAMEVGLREVVERDSVAVDLAGVLSRLAVHLDCDALAVRSTPGQLIAFTGAKSGVGSTTLAVNLAVELAGAGRNVVLVDADTQFGDAALLLGLHPAAGMVEATTAEVRPTGVRLNGLLTRHDPSGLRVLTAPASPEAGSGIEVPAVLAAIEAVAALAEIVVVDVPAGLSELSLAVLDLADTIGLVMVPSPTSVHDAVLEMGILQRLQLRPKVQLVMNRCLPDRAPARRHLERSLGRPVAALVPESADVALAEAQGRPIALHRRHRVAGAVRDLAAVLASPAAIGV